jgi:putative hydrolase of the HAD superfamily
VVTFDCWSTLIYEVNPERGRGVRIEALETIAGRHAPVDRARASEAFHAAWGRHWELWQEGIASGAEDMARWSLERLEVSDTGAHQELTARYSESSLQEEIRPLDGARETLERLTAAGIRRALICDTGFTPGRLVRQLLDRAGLLEYLEVQIFSDEVGVPKPDPRVFEAALGALGERAEGAVHVGDLRPTDIAGARGVGMGSVRIRWHHDDQSEHPEADAVAESHAHLREILSL